MSGELHPLTAHPSGNFDLIDQAADSLTALEALFQTQPSLDEVPKLQNIFGIFAKLEEETTFIAGRKELLKKINQTCYSILRRGGKIGCCSCFRFWGPSYFRRLDAAITNEFGRHIINQAILNAIILQ